VQALKAAKEQAVWHLEDKTLELQQQ